jgi:hypothetical protein
MLENQLLVVQKLFQWKVRDPNWIHRRLSKNHDCIRLEQISKESKTAIKNTLNQWQWLPAWNKEDLGQSALTEAHGDCAGGQSSPWEPRIGKRK